MLRLDWKQISSETSIAPKYVGTFNRIQDFNWWFDGKERKEVLICYSYKNGHAYMVAGKYELHGHLFFKKIKTRLFSRIFTLRPILFFRFTHFSQQDIAKIENEIEARVGGHEISCMELIRVILENSVGIKINGFHRNMIYLQQFVDTITRNGFSTLSGQSVPFEIYQTENWSKMELYKHLGRLEKRFFWLGHSGLILARMLRFPKEMALKWRGIFRNQSENVLSRSSRTE